MSGWSEGRPGDVEPGGGCQELVGEGMTAEEGDETLELGGVTGTDVGSLAEQVLGTGDTTDKAVDAKVAEAGVDDEGTADGLAGRLKQEVAAIGHVDDVLQRGLVVGVLLAVDELFEAEMRRELDVIDCCAHGSNV